jgi:hypothetical protein
MRRAALVLALAVSASHAQGRDDAVPAAGVRVRPFPPPAAIRVEFKLDSRLTTGLYMGARWVSPPTFSASAAGVGATIDARASGVDARGRPAKIAARWSPEDPEMVTVEPAEGNDVRVSVRREGETVLRVTSGGVTRPLVVKAVRRDEVLRVEIAQR